MPGQSLLPAGGWPRSFPWTDFASFSDAFFLCCCCWVRRSADGGGGHVTLSRGDGVAANTLQHLEQQVAREKEGRERAEAVARQTLESLAGLKEGYETELSRLQQQLLQAQQQRASARYSDDNASTLSADTPASAKAS